MSVASTSTVRPTVSPLSLHDALPILMRPPLAESDWSFSTTCAARGRTGALERAPRLRSYRVRSEEHTSELQSRQYLVCRLLLEKENERQARQNPAAPSCLTQQYRVYV